MDIFLNSVFAINGGLYMFRNKFYFHGEQGIHSIPKDVNRLQIDGIDVWVWTTIKSGVSKKTIIFSHGNAGNLESWSRMILPFYKKYLSQDFDLIMYDYPGFGDSIGSSSPNSAVKALKIVLHHFLTNSKRLTSKEITLWGSSMGGAITAQTVRDLDIPFENVILQSTFTSLKDMIYLTVGMLSYCLFFIPNELDTFENLKKIKESGKSSVSLLHSREDDIIPFSQFVKNSARISRDKTMVIKGTHNNPVLDSKFASVFFKT